MDHHDMRLPDQTESGISRSPFFSVGNVDSLVLDLLGVATMSDTVLQTLRDQIAENISNIDVRLSVICKEKEALEGDRAVLVGMARLASASPVKEILPRPHQVLPGARPLRRGVAGMRESSKKRRIWNELEQMLIRQGGPIQRQQILDHMVKEGFVDEDRRGSVGNLLEEYRKAGLIDSDDHGYWFLPSHIEPYLAEARQSLQQEDTEMRK